MLLVNIGWVLVLAVPLFCLCLDSLAEGVAYFLFVLFICVSVDVGFYCFAGDLFAIRFGLVGVIVVVLGGWCFF